LGGPNCSCGQPTKDRVRRVGSQPGPRAHLSTYLRADDGTDIGTYGGTHARAHDKPIDNGTYVSTHARPVDKGTYVSTNLSTNASTRLGTTSTLDKIMP
jgi:hypothetical protein